MTQMRFVLAFLLITFLFFSESVPSSSANSDHERTALSTHSPLKSGVISHLMNLQESSRKQLRVYTKKRASNGGIATRARGKTSAAVSVHHHVPSIIACCLLQTLMITFHTYF
ncbi:hypothetical protein Ddye_021989 [Dipteronia dyeriana]|uniref:Uncharacterized protein n=1 Tax=Dipteronia dyeriana TaxID=168575 RepID=A0AAD9U2Q5_9ROSI|nr:hypothetical protein Ddye_021989 [Dipteronia dyeriana]